MDLGLTGKVALVAAASQGLGKAVATELCREGADVIICARNADLLEATATELRALGGGRVVAVPADLTADDAAQTVVDAGLKAFGRIDILVTNTGGPPSGPFENHTIEAWDQAYKLLLRSAVTLIQAVVPGMKAQQAGRIITITSQAVKQPVNNLILSNSIRTSVVGLMKTLATELGPYNITVNNVMPGYTRTERLDKLVKTDPKFSNVITDIPLGRIGEPEEFAAMVAFLTSDRASYISGVSVQVDGGWTKSLF